MSLSNVMLVQTKRLWAEIGDLTSETANGRHEDTLGLPDVDTEDEAVRITDQVLTTQANAHAATVARIEPADDLHTPYRGFGGYDTISCRGPNAVEDMRVRQIGMAVDSNRYPIWTLGLNDLVTERDAQVDRLLRRRAPGGLGGKTETSNPGSPASPIEDVATNVRERTWNKSGPLTAGGSQGDDETLAGTYHLLFFTVTLTFADTTSDVVVELKVSGTTIETVTIPAGTNIVYVPLHREIVVQTDVVAVVITDTGTDAEGLTATLKFT